MGLPHFHHCPTFITGPLSPLARCGHTYRVSAPSSSPLPIGLSSVPNVPFLIQAFHHLYRDLALGVLMEDAQGRTVYANQELHTLLRLPDGEDRLPLGISATDYLAPAMEWLMEPDAWEPVMENERAQLASPRESEIETIDGRFFVRFHSRVDVGGEFAGHFWIFREFTEYEALRREAIASRSLLAEANRELSETNQDLQRTNRLLASVLRIQDLVLSTGDEKEVFDQILNAAIELTRSEFGFFAEVVFDPARGRSILVSRAMSVASWDESRHAFFSRQEANPLIFDNANSLFGYVQHTGQPLITNDPAHHPHATGVPDGHPPLESFAGLPVMVRDQVVGVLGLANRPGGYSDQLATWMELFLSTCAAVITHVRGTRERREVMERLSTASRKAEQANAAKDAFLSSMSHEIRTPLNGILGFSQLISMRSISESDRKDAQRIITAGRHLVTLVDDVLDLAAVEAGRISINPQETDVSALVQDACRIMQELALASQCTVTFETTGLSTPVRIDPVRLRQVILNLIENALKYGCRGGSVSVRARTHRGHLIIDVADQGPGIPPERRDEIFEPFFRLASTAADTTGRGLGLSVSRSLAEAMGGSLSLVSADPGNCIFRLSVPLTTQIESPRQDVRPGRPNMSVTGSVLYVEDTQSNIELVTAAFSFWLPQVELRLAHTTSKARESWQRQRPDVVLLDWHLPDSDGSKALHELQQLEIPVIVVTADASPSTRQKINDIGECQVLIKPLTIEELIDMTITHLQM